MIRLRTSMTRLPVVLGAAGAALLAGAGVASADTEVAEPSSFTSAFTAMATPDQVVNEGQPAPGEPGATGTFNYRINADSEIICYDITLSGVTPPYQSMARTSTHIHEGARGESGPPRVVFPNPQDDGSGQLVSSGCLQGPFTTGIEADDGTDTGQGFSLAEIEANPAAFFTDSHTEQFVPGAVRGQLRAVPVGGVETGAGGTAGSDPTVAVGLGGAALLVAGGAVVAARRRTSQV